jgi:hypothetical protein
LLLKGLSYRQVSTKSKNAVFSSLLTENERAIFDFQNGRISPRTARVVAAILSQTATDEALRELNQRTGATNPSRLHTLQQNRRFCAKFTSAAGRSWTAF